MTGGSKVRLVSLDHSETKLKIINVDLFFMLF
jgi:hypothetical protein